MPETSGRPRVVNAAYWLWLVAAIILVLFGLLAVTADGDAIRDRLVERDYSADDAHRVVLLLRASGGVSLVVGLAIGLMSGAVRNGHARFRRALVALSIVFAVLQLVEVLIGLSAPALVLVPLLLGVASVLVYRDSAQPWFEDGT